MKLNWCRLQSGDSGLEAALAFSALQWVKESGEPILLFDRPAPVVSFSKLDRLSPGFDEAVAAARASGATPVSRISGGQAVAAHPGCLRLTFAAPHARGELDLTGRFAAIASPVREAIEAMGFEIQAGEVAGEWCPGDYSLSLGGVRKIAGIGQRSVAEAHHICALVTASDPGQVREMLQGVYESLGYDFDPASVGELPGATLDELEGQILRALSGSWELSEIKIPGEILDLAGRAASSYLL